MVLDFSQFSSYVRSSEPVMPALFRRLQEEAEKESIPILRFESVTLLRTLIAAAQPKRILEIGTAIGYSALWMAQMMPEDAQLLTLELDPAMADRAESNIREAGLSDRIRVLRGDAAALLPTLRESFDFIFLDAAKGQYVRWLPELLRLLAPRGQLLADNILQQGSFFLPREQIPHRDRTIYDRLHSFMDTLTHTEGLCTSLISLGDGMSLSVNIGLEKENMTVKDQA